MKNKKGFISISVIYSFFVIFLLFLVLIMSSYINNRFKFNVYKNDIKKKLLSETDIYLSEYIKSLESGTVKTSSNGTSYYIKNINNVTRYQGSNPDNYIKFNDQIWRVVGIFQGRDIGLSSSKYYTKIIASNGVSILYSNSLIGTWSDSTAKTILNNNYYMSIASDQKNAIASARWYQGRVSSYNANNASLSSLVSNEKNGNTNVDKVGVISLSDVGLASLQCSSLTRTLGTCRASNWLLNCPTGVLNYYLTNNIFYINSSGNIIHKPGRSYFNFYPVVYLDSSVKLVSGKGTSSNPYIIEI